jgi:hypothetical protein
MTLNRARASGVFRILVFLDFHHHSVAATHNQSIWCVAMLRAAIVVLQGEGLLLPRVGASRSCENLPSLDLVLRFGVPRASTEDIGYLALNPSL